MESRGVRVSSADNTGVFPFFYPYQLCVKSS